MPGEGPAANGVVANGQGVAIRCRGLRKRFKSRSGAVEAVQGLDLEVRQGECFGLLGPNGAGKTTTIEILEGLQQATSGEVEVLGSTWGAHAEALRQRLGISLQETRFAEKLSVEETLTLFRSFYRRGLEPEEGMRLVSLQDKRRAWVGKLSGGQKQRLAVACALVGDPDLLFLDEPTTGLDPQSRRSLWEVIRDLRARGRTILLTTHYMDEAERLCDRVAVVDAGRVIALGSPMELVARLGGDHVIEFALEERRDASDAAGALRRLDESDYQALPGVRGARLDAGGVSLTVTEPHRTLPALLERLASEGLALARLTTRHVSLEDVFVNLTGRHLRDETGVGV
ncbi:MAG TPA: ABC transporter ATP-binding protein [Candidatus Polarisedimenticolia bacterium]|jgi:ABC-2 type transport system ATP-binding protein|nr:ABC transporter ATP-binding protein [Candidatus Polarisedimenticolia bacterium]